MSDRRVEELLHSVMGATVRTQWVTIKNREKMHIMHSFSLLGSVYNKRKRRAN